MIKGNRVILRPVDEADLGLITEWFNDQELAQWVGGWSFPLSFAEQREWFKRTVSDQATRRFIVSLANDGSPIGVTGLWHIDWRNRHALTALKLGVAATRGQGLGTDAILTMCAYAFRNVGLNRLWTEVLSFNAASYRAYVKKCGWKLEGRSRQHVLRDGTYHDQFRLGLLRDEFEQLPLAQPYLVTLPRVSVIPAPEDLA